MAPVHCTKIRLLMSVQGSSTDLTAPKSNFRFTPENGLKSDIASCPGSANIRSDVGADLIRSGEPGIDRRGKLRDLRRAASVQPVVQAQPDDIVGVVGVRGNASAAG
jgi:hypothetical protein